MCTIDKRNEYFFLGVYYEFSSNECVETVIIEFVDFSGEWKVAGPACSKKSAGQAVHLNVEGEDDDSDSASDTEAAKSRVPKGVYQLSVHFQVFLTSFI